MSENKIITYILYATGEIVLVIIGILIAVSIDDWNNQRIKIANEEELFVSLEQELTNNLSNLENAINQNVVFYNEAKYVLNKLEAGETKFKESEISQTFDYRFIFLNSPILIDIITKDADLLVQKKGLIGDLRQLDFHYGRITKNSSFLDELWNLHITTFFIKAGVNYQHLANSTRIIDLAELEKAGYNKNQIISLINLKLKNQEFREDSMIESLNQTKITLEKIRSSNTK